MITARLWPAAALLCLASCATTPREAASSASSRSHPKNAIIGASGYATILNAPPSTPESRRARGIEPSEDDEQFRNPDDAASRAADALDRRLTLAEPDNYIGRRIVRDPKPRFAFQFRHNAASTLARYTDDPRFASREGGWPVAELQPIFDEWFPRFIVHRLVGGGSVQEFDGVVAMDMTIDEPTFRKIAVEQGWTLPARLKLNFGPLPRQHANDPMLAPLVRIFARSDRLPGAVNQAALSGRIILRDGCFRLAEHGDSDEPLVLFDRDAELSLDTENYMVLRDGEGPGHTTRVGERIVWAGPRGTNEMDAGMKALREQCGAGPVIAIGSPTSAASFPPLH